jgi:hypothetical protein
MRNDKSALLEQAERCRRLAHAINTTDVVEKLLTMAEDYEEQAARLAASGPPLVPSEAPEPPRCAQMDVARRAYYLWERAGHPDGRAEEFYFEAERQLRDEASATA